MSPAGEQQPNTLIAKADPITTGPKARARPEAENMSSMQAAERGPIVLQLAQLAGTDVGFFHLTPQRLVFEVS